eukprot:3688881-Prymnesium_polylepis.1
MRHVPQTIQRANYCCACCGRALRSLALVASASFFVRRGGCTLSIYLSSAASSSPAMATPVSFTVGALASDHALFHDNSQDLIKSTRKALSWRDVPAPAGGAVDAMLAQHRAMLFAVRCTYASDAATLLALAAHDRFALGLNAPAFDRVI